MGSDVSASAPAAESRPQGGATPDYPAGWEADVVLRDGRTARLRPIRPQDENALASFHALLSDQTIYFRFFAPHPTLSESELHNFTHVDHRDRVALVVVMKGEIVGVGRYDRIGADDAEVAFVIRDDHQGLGIGSLLLEHLAAAAREHGIGRFVAEVLPANSRMLATFRYAGFQVVQGYDEGVVSLSLDIEPTGHSDAVRDAREQRSEARSLFPLLRPHSVVVVGASRRPGTVGHVLLKNLIMSGFPGFVFAVHPSARQILGVTCQRSLEEIQEIHDGDVDLVVIAVAAEEVPGVIESAARIGARGVVVVSSGFDDRDSSHGVSTPALARLARDAGMRLLGPAALGIVNTDQETSLNASLLDVMPRTGTIGFFCQSGALAVDIMRRMATRGLGVSDFVSAGHRADVSGNDLLQFWEEDESTRSVMLYLETVGNPRKFARLAERTARHKPVVVLRTTGARTPASAPAQISTSSSPDVPANAYDQIISDTGVIEVSSLDQLLDVAEVLQIRGGLHSGRIGLVGNSEAVEILARNAAEQWGLDCLSESRILSRSSSPHRFRRYLDETVRDSQVDIVVALYVPPIESTDNDSQARALIAELAATVAKPIVAVVLGWNATALRETVRDRLGAVLPIFTDVEHAMAAIGRVVAYTRSIAEREANETGSIPVPGCQPMAVRATIAQLMENSEDVDNAGSYIDVVEEQAGSLFTDYGLPAWQEATDDLHRDAIRITATRDRLLGPVVSVGLASPIAEALGDRHYALAPLTEYQALRLVRRSAMSLLEDGGAHTDSAQELLGNMVRRIAALLHDHPRIDDIEAVVEPVDPPDRWNCRTGRIRIAIGPGDRLWGARSLSRLPQATGWAP